MAVIKYQINGKADTKPIKDTEAAAQGMFKKIQAIDNTLKAFVGVKVFAEVNKAIKGTLVEYDKFQTSLKGETNFSKQFDSLKTTMAGTLGTMRDGLLDIVSEIAGKDWLEKLEETIPKIGAALVGGFAVVSTIVSNIKDTLQPGLWKEFFSHAFELGSAFVSFFGNLLKDTLINALEVFKWGIKGLGITDMFLDITSSISKSMMRMQMSMMPAAMRADMQRMLDDLDRQVAEEKAKANVFPNLQLSENTKTAAAAFATELGKAFKPLLDGLAGTDVGELYNDTYAATLERIKTILEGMFKVQIKEDKKESAEGLKKQIKTTGKSTAESDLTKLILRAISRLVDVFSNISGPFAAFLNSFDVFLDVVEEVCAVLEPALSAIFKPIVDIVRQLAIVFGTFLNMLSPVLSLVGMVSSALQILSPFLYLIGIAFAAIADGFAHVYNVVSSIVKGLTFGVVNIGTKDTDNRKRFEEIWNSQLDYDQYQNSNNSTSYNVSGDMYIDINFSHSYVNGDTREIAIMLRDEIRLVESQGY